VIHVFRLALAPLLDELRTQPLQSAARWHLDLDDIESRTQRGLAALYGRLGQTRAQRAAETRAEQLARAENALLREWDRLYVCSGRDRDELLARPLTRLAEVVVRPNVVEVPADPPPAPRRDPLAVLLVGTFAYFPNQDAAVWLCREVLPALRELSREPLRVLLAGTGATGEVADLGHIPEVTVLGALPDIADAYRQADVVVVPLRAGGGTRIKLLEALAHRRPVVSTTIGAEGLELVDGRELLLADRPFHFAQQCLRLLGDPALAERLAQQGRARVLADYRRPSLPEAEATDD
jgi:glycosyltransferase involved in cell wall biosynthesis